MKNLIPLVMLSLCIGYRANAQVRISVLAGPSFTTFSGSDVELWGSVNEKPKMVIRFHGGLLVSYPFNEKLNGITGLQYSVKGATYKGTDDIGDGGTVDAEYKKFLHYIDIPLSVQYALSDKFGIQAGTQISILMDAKVKNGQEVQDAYQLPATEDVKDDYKKFDMCLNIGPVYSITEKLSAQLLYQLGLVKIGQYADYGADVTYNVKNQGIKLSLIYAVK